PLRWRGNIHVDGLEAWEEFTLVGKTLRVGGAEFRVEEPITRCLATHANPKTGKRDAGVLAALDRKFNHQEFGMNLVVIRSGDVAVGDLVEILQ
ncbi:MAG: MOSC domain-containing protein, partial [Pseudomonadota bacterium]